VSESQGVGGFWWSRIPKNLGYNVGVGKSPSPKLSDPDCPLESFLHRTPVLGILTSTSRNITNFLKLLLKQRVPAVNGGSRGGSLGQLPPQTAVAPR